MFVKALRIGVSYLVRIYPDCMRVFCCLVNVTSKHLKQLVRDFSFKSVHTCPATSYNLVMTFCNVSGTILSGISALCH